jgi:hypothetical protein
MGRDAYKPLNYVVERVTILAGSVIAVWHIPRYAPSMLYQLDMGKSWYATIHADYWRAQIEEENRWQIKISL